MHQVTRKAALAPHDGPDTVIKLTDSKLLVPVQVDHAQTHSIVLTHRKHDVHRSRHGLSSNEASRYPNLLAHLQQLRQKVLLQGLLDCLSSVAPGASACPITDTVQHMALYAEKLAYLQHLRQQKLLQELL